MIMAPGFTFAFSRNKSGLFTFTFSGIKSDFYRNRSLAPAPPTTPHPLFPIQQVEVNSRFSVAFPLIISTDFWSKPIFISSLKLQLVQTWFSLSAMEPTCVDPRLDAQQPNLFTAKQKKVKYPTFIISFQICQPKLEKSGNIASLSVILADLFFTHHTCNQTDFPEWYLHFLVFVNTSTTNRKTYKGLWY